MTALTGLDDIINRATGGGAGPAETIWFQESAFVGGTATVTVASRMSSLWQYEGQPSGGVAPTTVAVPTNATAGSIQQTNAGGGRQKYLIGVNIAASAVGTLVLYDRLLHIGGLNATTITAQTVAGALTRNTGGLGNQIWVEIYTAIGSTATTITASYTNQAGTAGQTTQATPFGGVGLDEVQRIIPLPLAQGDAGVQACASVTVLASTLTAGNFGVTIARPLLYIPIGVGGVGGVRDLILNAPGIIPIDANACLAWAWFANSTGGPTIMGSAHFIEA